ncbi:MAG: DegV family protein [Clostridia bacterium]
MKYAIISDSACDLKNDYLKNKDIYFESIPFFVNVLDKEFEDTDNAPIDEMLTAFSATKELCVSACPSPQKFYEACLHSDYSFIITITSKLSGSFNSACLAKTMAEQEGKKVFAIDSKATCGVQVQIIDKLVQLIESGISYEEICKQIAAFVERRNLVFVLKNFDNLIRNGRMKNFIAKIITALKITPLCVKSPEGEISMKDKIIGEKRLVPKVVDIINKSSENIAEIEVIISHCRADEQANEIKQMLLATNPNIKNIRIIPTQLLASFYALPQGIIISY